MKQLFIKQAGAFLLLCVCLLVNVSGIYAQAKLRYFNSAQIEFGAVYFPDWEKQAALQYTLHYCRQLSRRHWLMVSAAKLYQNHLPSSALQQHNPGNGLIWKRDITSLDLGIAHSLFTSRLHKHRLLWGYGIGYRRRIEGYLHPGEVVNPARQLLLTGKTRHDPGAKLSLHYHFTPLPEVLLSVNLSYKAYLRGTPMLSAGAGIGVQF